MAGSIVATQTIVERGLPSLIGSVAGGLRMVVKTSIAWTSDASGDVNANTVAMPCGSICSVQFTPSGGGTAPTALYDVTFTNADSVNLFDDGGGTSIGANLSATVSTLKVPFISGAASTFVRAWLAGGTYTPVVAAAGNAKEGTIVIYQVLDVL